MADVRLFKGYIEELSGNNLLKKQIAVLEKANARLESELKELKEEVKLFKKEKGSQALPKTGKKRGRKSRTMLQIIEDEMAKTKDKQMKVTDIVKVLKNKFESKAKNMYASVAASMNNSNKFVKAAPGVYKLVAEGDAKQQPKKKAATLVKKAVAKKVPAKKAVASSTEPEVKKPVAKKKAVAAKKPVAKKKAPAKKKPAAKKKVAAKKPAADKPVS